MDIRFPEHEFGLYLEHNPHRDTHQTVEQYLTTTNGLLEFESEELRRECIETGELWTLQWYPRTPITFYAVAAPTLERLLAFAQVVAVQVKALNKEPKS